MSHNWCFATPMLRTPVLGFLHASSRSILALITLTAPNSPPRIVDQEADIKRIMRFFNKRYDRPRENKFAGKKRVIPIDVVKKRRKINHTEG